ncbi:3-oxoacyl-ACP reductase FabG [Roseococcus sp. SDR]|uniref:SDR family NAD(P)-dependent oxidoreductase n=1 Tax=Roseococcus sp. SDR TaxID=2835532 RepID=UPI001BCCDCFE|nr:3-oxoacyl-ACP reductase family protein [Roseococcus sp. SDR]MBS7791157.1 3-oxoacyl-ACP reductase FabG [Roseococcus sp. SDR]MBV1846471.1 3-oxoacyl-ACP reductase FabG [Roseococcus sp. SDR]
MTRCALITGAGRNIGRAVALALAKQGMNVVINGSTDQAACERVAKEARALGVEAHVAMGDVGDRATCRRLAEAAIARFGRVDVLVNNAALRPSNKFLDLTEADYRRVIAVDLEAAIWLSQACLPGMLEAGWGRIVNFAGMNAIHGYAGRAPVSVAKHGVWGLTKSLAKEFGPKGVTVNAISPGPIASDDEDVAPDAHRQEMVVRVPVGRLGQPAEVAAMVRLLASDEGAFINGQMLAVNGGAET